MADENGNGGKPRIRLSMVAGKWVPMQALMPMSLEAWKRAAEETRRRVELECKAKAKACHE